MRQDCGTVEHLRTKGKKTKLKVQTWVANFDDVKITSCRGTFDGADATL